jgi:hypothetical protein
MVMRNFHRYEAAEREKNQAYPRTRIKRVRRRRKPSQAKPSQAGAREGQKSSGRSHSKQKRGDGRRREERRWKMEINSRQPKEEDSRRPSIF